MAPRIFTAAAVAALALAPAAAARLADSVSTATANGAGGVATVSVGASHPHYLTISIGAAPSQRIGLTWGVRCSNGLNAGTGSGPPTALAPLTRTFRFTATTPATCSAHASARLSYDGRLTVKIIRG